MKVKNYFNRILSADEGDIDYASIPPEDLRALRAGEQGAETLEKQATWGSGKPSRARGLRGVHSGGTGHAGTEMVGQRRIGRVEITQDR